MSIVLVLIGALFVVIALCDAANTLISTRLQVGRWWPSEVFLRGLWPIWRTFGRVRSDRHREIVLSAFAPLALLSLLVLWVVAELVGWALIWWGLRESFGPALADPGDAFYFSGVSFFTVGFGDLLPVGGFARMLSVLEAFSGLGTLALVIGYLPALYGAYNTRETQLLMLDDLTGERITPASLIEAHTPDGDVAPLYAFFHEWERWCAQVLESHTSYPMLALFRSQHVGQSWITALGVVLDAASMSVGSIEGADRRQPMFLFRRGNRLLHHFAGRFGVAPPPSPEFDRTRFRTAYDRMAAAGLPLREFEEAWELTLSYRLTYAAQLEGLIDQLLAPRGFWSHTVLGDVRLSGVDEEHPTAQPTG